MTSMSASAERITQEPRPRAEIDAWAKASAEMYCAYLARLGARDRAAQSALPGNVSAGGATNQKSSPRGGAAAPREAKEGRR